MSPSSYKVMNEIPSRMSPRSLQGFFKIEQLITAWIQVMHCSRVTHFGLPFRCSAYCVSQCYGEAVPMKVFRTASVETWGAASTDASRWCLTPRMVGRITRHCIVALSPLDVMGQASKSTHVHDVYSSLSSGVRAVKDRIRD